MTVTPSPYDHVRATAQAPVDPGVYRVVGVTEDAVTLLRVTDMNGRREHTGDVVSVPVETLDDSFETAEDPDAGFAIRSFLSPLVTMPKALAYWLRRR